MNDRGAHEIVDGEARFKLGLLGPFGGVSSLLALFLVSYFLISLFSVLCRTCVFVS
jgi:hypothetical protein